MAGSGPSDATYPCDAVSGERVLRGVLHWSVSWRDAGVPVEEDGVGIAPPRVRALLLAQHGEWRVRVDDAHAGVKVAAALRAAFSAPLRGAATAAPGIVHRGTRGEAVLLTELLSRAGVHAVLVAP